MFAVSNLCVNTIDHSTNIGHIRWAEFPDPIVVSAHIAVAAADQVYNASHSVT
jgi:hypothetical protein